MLAVLGLVVLGVAIFAIQNPRGTHTAAADPTTSASSPGPSPTLSSGSSTSPARSSSSASSGSSSPTLPSLDVAQREPLIVLNNTTTTGLAQSAAARFGNAGWTVTSYGNLQNNILSTCAYYDPSDPAARPAARVLRKEFPTIKRVEPKFPQLPSGPIVVVLTPDYTPA